jgi:hypothetical protein
LFLPPPTAAQTTQTLSLDEGWNLVSLRVQPEDPSFVSIFGGTDGAISSVKNEDGAAYLPALGIEQISTWRADEGYKVHAETATTIKIVGTDLSPGSVAIALEEGGNIVPYLPERTQAVEEAVMSIEESLIAVEDEEGRRYPSGSPSLDSLRPGQGYKVYVDRADTLRYPAVVKTLNDALAMTGMEVGSYVRVRGRDAPGDKGGGLFRVTNNACRTDGGTCFGFDENLSSEQEIVETGDLWGGDLPHSDLAWRSVEIQWGPSSSDVWTIWDLHGHIAKLPHRELVDTKRGFIKEANYPGYRRDFVDGEPDWHIRYKHLTSDRRLQRLEVANNTNPDRLSVAWWGTTPVSEGWSGLEDDNTNEINWTLATARRWRENGSLDAVYVDVPGVYWKLYRSLKPDRVMVRGTGPSTTWPDGTVTKGGFKMPPGEALWHMDDREDPRMLLQDKKFGFRHGRVVDWEGFESIVINGNLSGNQDPFDNESYYGGKSAITSGLQNLGYWTAWRSSDEGNATEADIGQRSGYVDGMDLKWDNVAIVSMAGNGANNSNGGIDISDWNQIFFDTALRNHMVYGFAGSPANVTTEGEEGGSWGALNKLGTFKGIYGDGNWDANKELTHARKGVSANWSATWEGLTMRNLKDNPEYVWSEAVNVQVANTTVDDFTIDFSETVANNFGRAHLNFFFNNGYPGANIKNGIIRTPPPENPSKKPNVLFDPGFKWPKTLQDYEVEKFEKIEIIDQHEPGVDLFKQFQGLSTNVIFREVKITPKNVSGVGSISAIKGSMMVPRGDNQNIPGAKRMDFESVTWGRPVERIANVVTQTGDVAFPLDLFVSGSTIENQSDISINSRSASEGINGGGAKQERVYMSNTTFNVPISGVSNDEFHKAFDPSKSARGGPRLRIRNCTTPDGRTSEEGGTFTSSASDEGNDFVLIPTSLLSRVYEADLSLTSSPSGISSITGWDVANSDGTLRSDDANYEHDPYLKVSLDGTIGTEETVSIDYTARVTPLGKYSPTGVFTTRPPNNHTYTSGSGPWTLDLRGVAASQETWTPPAYSASSSDAGVVTANVTATNHRGTDRYWTLELTEQGTGTATVTVDASISGVGTATTTFEVTVE